MSVQFDVREQQEMEFVTGGSIVMDYELVFWPEAMVWIVQNWVVNILGKRNAKSVRDKAKWSEIARL